MSASQPPSPLSPSPSIGGDGRRSKTQKKAEAPPPHTGDKDAEEEEAYWSPKAAAAGNLDVVPDPEPTTSSSYQGKEMGEVSERPWSIVEFTKKSCFGTMYHKKERNEKMMLANLFHPWHWPWIRIDTQYKASGAPRNIEGSVCMCVDSIEGGKSAPAPLPLSIPIPHPPTPPDRPLGPLLLHSYSLYPNLAGIESMGQR